MTDPFRDASHVRSETLEQLALRHPEAGAIREIEAAPDAALDSAAGRAVGDEPPAGCLPAFAWMAAVGVGLWWVIGNASWLAPVLAGGGVVASHLLHVGLRALWRRRVARQLAWVDAQPFPITGIRGYLAAQPAMIDVTFAKPPLPGAVQAGVRGHSPGADVQALDDRTFRVVLPAGDGARRGPTPDLQRLRAFVEEVLVPVHRELDVTAVRLGGRLAPGPAWLGDGDDANPKKPDPT